MIKYHTGFAREAVDSPSQEILKTALDKTLSVRAWTSLSVGAALRTRELDQMTYRSVFSN